LNYGNNDIAILDFRLPIANGGGVPA